MDAYPGHTQDHRTAGDDTCYDCNYLRCVDLYVVNNPHLFDFDIAQIATDRTIEAGKNDKTDPIVGKRTGQVVGHYNRDRHTVTDIQGHTHAHSNLADAHRRMLH